MTHVNNGNNLGNFANAASNLSPQESQQIGSMVNWNEFGYQLVAQHDSKMPIINDVPPTGNFIPERPLNFNSPKSTTTFG